MIVKPSCSTTGQPGQRLYLLSFKHTGTSYSHIPDIQLSTTFEIFLKALILFTDSVVILFYRLDSNGSSQRFYYFEMYKRVGWLFLNPGLIKVSLGSGSGSGLHC